MAKFNFELSFVANVSIDAPDEKAALLKAEDIMESHSVYDDERLEKMHDDAYCAGGLGGDPPLKRKHAYEMRTRDFEPRVPILISRRQKARKKSNEDLHCRRDGRVFL